MEPGFCPRIGDEVETLFGVGKIVSLRERDKKQVAAIWLRENELKFLKVELPLDMIRPKRRNYA